MPVDGNLFSRASKVLHAELFEILRTGTGFRLERIVSRGHRTPEGRWLRQEQAEWVVLLSGGAELSFEGERKPAIMKPGDYCFIAAGRRHRVERTAKGKNTVWLALHWEPKRRRTSRGTKK